MTGDETGVQFHGNELGMGKNPAKEGQVSFDAADLGLAQHSQQTQACFFPVVTPGNQLT
ncbi:hypothetical protein D3C75_1295830 [compost metagenome]